MTMKQKKRHTIIKGKRYLKGAPEQSANSDVWTHK